MRNNFAAMIIYGRPFPEVGLCVCHGNPVDITAFRDEASRKEYMISRLCQSSQDRVFHSDDYLPADDE
jgi:hypothetical protein